MNTQKTKDRGHSVNALATLLNADRRTIAKVVIGLPAAGVKGKTKLYRLEDVRAAFKAKEHAVGRLRVRELTIRCDRLQLKFDKERAALIDVATVKAELSATLLKIRAHEGVTMELDPYLTPSEREVLEYLLQGLADKQIAAQIGNSERTVRFHVQSLFKKFYVNCRMELAAHFLDMARKDPVSFDRMTGRRPPRKMVV